MVWYLFALASALFSAASAIVEKKILFKENAMDMTFVLSLFTFFLSIPFFFIMDVTKITAVGLGILLFKSIINAIAFYCVMCAIKGLQLSNALPLLATTPLFVAIFAFIFIKEALSSFEIIGIMLIVGGTYLLELNIKQGISYPIKVLIQSKGHRYVIAALALFTASSILDKVALGKFKFELNVFMGFQHLFFAITFLVMFFILGRNLSSFKGTLKNSWKWILVLAVFSIIYRYSQIAALQFAAVAVVLSIKRISVFFASVIGGTIFKESNLLRKSIATALIIVGAVLLI